MPTSPDYLLRTIRRTPLPESPTPRVLGVDDWALRRGQRYGTILCDLERHRVVELLPERSSHVLALWLRQHPGVEIISRDRGDYYIKGATQGAPSATQVTDRWHLLKNLREALMRAVDRQLPKVQAVATSVVATEPVDVATPTPDPEDLPLTAEPKREDPLRQQRRQRRLDRYQSVVTLHEQGVSLREIARRLHMHRSTVRKFVAAGRFPERAHRPYRRGTDAFEGFLQKRWEEGCHNARQLFAELCKQGFQGSYDMVRRKVAQWRTRRQNTRPKTTKTKPSFVRRPSSNQVAWLLFKSPSDLTPKEQDFVKSLKEHCPDLAMAATLSQQFSDLVRNRNAKGLDDWLAKAGRADGPPEIQRFGNGLQEDRSAVTAALSLPWSNGQTEGQVNRLKLVKRQMYGRANFDLLRQRFLHPV